MDPASPAAAGCLSPSSRSSSLATAAGLVALWFLCPLLMAIIDGLPIASARLDRDTAFIGYSERIGNGADFYKSIRAEECVDAGEFCTDWASNGECDSNPAYMSKSCMLSCGLCTGQAGAHEAGDDCSDCHSVELQTMYGAIVIKLREDWSPSTAGAVRELASRQKPGKACHGCQFYRSEKLPEPGATDNYGGPGPPYALLQGRLKGLTKLHREKAPLVERGMACLIGEGPDFFIAVGPHHEWGNGHTVWGQVDDMSTVDFIVNTLGIKHEVWGETQVTTLDQPLDIQLVLTDK